MGDSWGKPCFDPVFHEMGEPMVYEYPYEMGEPISGKPCFDPVFHEMGEPMGEPISVLGNPCFDPVFHEMGDSWGCFDPVFHEMGEPMVYEDFKEYTSSKQLNWCRIYRRDGKIFHNPELDPYLITDSDSISYSVWEMKLESGWVFWSREDGDSDPLHNGGELFLNNLPQCPNNLNLKHKITLALRQLILDIDHRKPLLVQFWGATTTLDGRTLLTTHHQPFALSNLYKGLCLYRMISKDYNFYVGVGGKNSKEEEDLGIPGRVFLTQMPEISPDVEYYSDKEHPLRNHALRCRLEQSWAFPVFEHSSPTTCVGVVELVGCDWARWPDNLIMGLCDAFQKLGLQCSPTKHQTIREENENKAHKEACMEIEKVSQLVSKFHELPFVHTWVPCSVCDAFLGGKEWKFGVESGNLTYFHELSSSEKSSVNHLRNREGVGRRTHSPPNLVYCSDVTKFSAAEYPWVHFAREASRSGFFAICVQSNYTGNDVYVVEFFLPKHDKDPMTLLSKILGTMKKNFSTLKLAYEDLGEELPVEVIEFQNGQKHHHVQILQGTGSMPIHEFLHNTGVMMQLDSSYQQSIDAVINRTNIVSTEQCNIDGNRPQGLATIKIPGRHTGVRIEIPYEDILHCSKLRRKDAAKKLKVSISTFKRSCRSHGISRWPPRNVDKVPSWPSHVDHHEEIPQFTFNLPSNQASASVTLTKPDDTAVQNIETVTVRAKYVDLIIKFRLSLSSRLVELQQQVAKRLNLEAGSYYIKYKDEEDELILIACDEDLQECINTFRSLGSTSIVILLEPK